MYSRSPGVTTLLSSLLFVLSTAGSLCMATAESNLSGPAPATFAHEAMGTRFEITLYPRPKDPTEDSIQRITAEAFEILDDLENRISSWRATSETAYLNSSASKQTLSVSRDIFELLITSRRIHQMTKGAFDITIGPLMRLYGFYDGTVRLPGPEERGRAMVAVGMEKVLLGADGPSVHFEVGGVALDFGAIGKGYALDRMAHHLKSRGIQAALLHGGTSTVVAIGTPPREAGWTVHVRHPYNREKIVDSVRLRNEALATSACVRPMQHGEESPCNVLDPRSGLPVKDTASATVIAKDGATADGLSTALLVLGMRDAAEFCAEHKDIRAIVIPHGPGRTVRPHRFNF